MSDAAGIPREDMTGCLACGWALAVLVILGLGYALYRGVVALWTFLT